MASKNNFFVKNKSILTFLILEVIALTAINFGNVSYIFGIAGAVLALFGCLFIINIVENKKQLLWVLLPIGILLAISAIGSFNGFSKVFSVTSNISLLVSIPGFFALGFFLRNLHDVKPRTVVLVIGVALAIATLFGLISTVIEYGPLYSLIYKSKPLYYYNGEPFDVTKEMYWLTGFEFGEVFVEYGSLFALLCAAFLPGLLFLSPKKERNDLIITAVVGGVGLLTLLVIPSWKGLLVLALASGFAFIFKFLKNHQNIQKIIGISFVALIGLGIIFFVVALINAAKGFPFTGFLKKLFETNGIMNKCTEILSLMFAGQYAPLENFWGLAPYEIYHDALMAETFVFEVQLLKEVGVIGAFLFIGFVVMMGYFLFKYIRKSDDHSSLKAIIVTMLLAFFIYQTLFFVVSISVHDSNSYVAFLRSPLLLVILFIFGYIFMPPEKKEKKHE